VISSLHIPSVYFFDVLRQKQQYLQHDVVFKFQEDQYTNDIRDDIKALTEEAVHPEADYTCMTKLKEVLEDAVDANIDQNELLASREVLEQLELRMSKVRVYLLLLPRHLISSCFDLKNSLLKRCFSY